ncbi:response regulator transcription factor [Virgibacillus sp. NKC19-3]|uniref:response regulator transcription factor n=1 Tax=Virgibacillus saliphilus TaxID=2831674 RepID=UPI001C9B2702|nr:response regulator transcription factor [Virgibacillus sp. NKC19-3]MBY7141909.1 response regulator transcription factor [Virgibacillus sp. NKC19-3]
MKKSVLCIEDNMEIGKLIKEKLEQHGFSVQWQLSGEGTEKEVLHQDVVILDIMLPGLDGFTVGKRLKEVAPMVPILLLSARTAVHDKVDGLQFADDYVTKPFHIDELIARLEVLMRRNGDEVEESIQLGKHIEVNLNAQTVINKSTQEEIVLTGKEHRILLYLLENANQILPKEKIFETVWDEPYIHGDKTLFMHIGHLRKKLEQNPDEPEIIETFKGIGYRLKR